MFENIPSSSEDLNKITDSEPIKLNVEEVSLDDSSSSMFGGSNIGKDTVNSNSDKKTWDGFGNLIIFQ